MVSVANTLGYTVFQVCISIRGFTRMNRFASKQGLHEHVPFADWNKINKTNISITESFVPDIFFLLHVDGLSKSTLKRMLLNKSLIIISKQNVNKECF